MLLNKLESKARANSVGFYDYDYDPTIIEQIGSSAGTIAGSVLISPVLKASIALGSPVVFASSSLDSLLGDGESPATRYLRNELAATVRQSIWLDENANNAGRFTRTVSAIGEVIGLFFGGGLVVKGAAKIATVAGGIQAYADYEKGLEQGLDKSTAAQKATVTGVTTALGGMIPLTMGIKLTPAAKMIAEAGGKWAKAGVYGKLIAHDVAYTSGAGISVGVGSRGLTHDILKANGYDQMADQYKAFDMEAMLVDGALGIIFGGAAKYAEIRQQRYIDTLFAKNNQIHQNIDSSIGIALDVQSMNAHDAAFGKAFEDMMLGKKIDVETILKNANFAIKNDLNWQNVFTEVLSQKYPEEAFYFTKNGTPIQAKVIGEIKQQITNKKDLAKLDNGIIPEHLVSKVVEKTGLKASEIKNSFSIYEKRNTDVISDNEFNQMLKNANYDDVVLTNEIDQILKEKPDITIPIVDEAGIESIIKASEILDSVRKEVELARNDKKLYDAAAECLLRNGR